jgi:hypothetical protein
MSDFDAISSLELFRDVPIDPRDEISPTFSTRARGDDFGGVKA